MKNEMPYRRNMFPRTVSFLSYFVICQASSSSSNGYKTKVEQKYGGNRAVSLFGAILSSSFPWLSFFPYDQ